MIAQIIEVGWPANVRVCLQTCVSVSAHTKAITSFIVCKSVRLCAQPVLVLSYD